ncbi:Phosphoribosylamine--glycine ligase [hydrothermal vent metagenome]|uniref:phosphoribosylamine--glycine ligase n=1 Tax=hydrothermal vent metagenome TaxID=652676 RepID=A0A3B0U392_9ZZZZ
MNILVIGSGGREHALAWKIKESPRVKKLYCAPGNGGISQIATCVDIKADDIDSLLNFAKDNKIDMTIVGPEVPLVEGIVDIFEKEGLKIFGPNKMAAQLEGSKIFSKEFMKECNIPTPNFKCFDDIVLAKEYLKNSDFPLVIKADGLAAGKGVIICKDLDEGNKALDKILGDKIFKEAGSRVIVEDCLEGEEVSILAVSDGHDYLILDTSQDHKRIFDDDQGPNTGGMGAYSPSPSVNQEMMNEIERSVIEPTIRGMKRGGAPFKGVLYAGIMLTDRGPYVLEYNVRFGDPEAQAVLPRMKNDLVDLLYACCNDQIKKIKLEWDSRDCVCVVISSGGYPGEYETGLEIKGLDQAAKQKDTVVFHAGTKEKDGKILTSGGRVLGVTSLGEGIDKAIKNSYEAVEAISFDRCFFRRDIGSKALSKMVQTPPSIEQR